MTTPAPNPASGNSGTLRMDGQLKCPGSSNGGTRGVGVMLGVVLGDLVGVAYAHR